MAEGKELGKITGTGECKWKNGKACHLCCFTYEVRVLPKPQAAHCRFENKKGCAIHNQSEQPHICAAYNCSNHPDDWFYLVTAGRLIGEVNDQMAREIMAKVDAFTAQPQSQVSNNGEESIITFTETGPRGLNLRRRRS